MGSRACTRPTMGLVGSLMLWLLFKAWYVMHTPTSACFAAGKARVFFACERTCFGAFDASHLWALPKLARSWPGGRGKPLVKRLSRNKPGSPESASLPRCPAFPPARGCRRGGCRWPTAQRAPSSRGESSAAFLQGLSGLPRASSGQGTTSGGSVNSCKAWAKTWAAAEGKGAARRSSERLGSFSTRHQTTDRRGRVRLLEERCRAGPQHRQKKGPKHTHSLSAPSALSLCRESEVFKTWRRRPLGAGPLEPAKQGGISSPNPRLFWD